MWLDITSSAGFDKASICLTGHYILLLFELLVSSEDFTHLLNHLIEHTVWLYAHWCITVRLSPPGIVHYVEITVYKKN